LPSKAYPVNGAQFELSETFLPSGGKYYTHRVQLVEGIQAARAESMEELYRVLLKSPRFFLASKIPSQEVDDRLHETFQVVVSAVQHGQLRDPQRLMGFVYTVLKRQVMLHFGGAVAERRRTGSLDEASNVPGSMNPEQAASSAERLRLTTTILEALPELERKVLIEFYLNEKPVEHICAELSLTETQFRNLKCRAKGRFGDVGRRRLSEGRLRKSAAQSDSGNSVRP
jgi:RNA polymerase sigma-70 factor, ECF subfamily